MLSAKFDADTGRFYNENGDVFKTAKEAIKHNEEIDKAFGKQDQVPKQMNDIDKIYSVSTPAEKAQMRREFKEDIILIEENLLMQMKSQR